MEEEERLRDGESYRRGSPRQYLAKKDFLESDREAFTSQTANLNSNDVAMIGTLIQVY